MISLNRHNRCKFFCVELKNIAKIVLAELFRYCYLSINSPFSNAKVDKSGSSSVGRASASQAEGREFEPRFPL